MPVPQGTVAPATGPVVAVRLAADGSVLVNGAASDVDGVTATVRENIRKHPDGSVAFSTERDLSYDRYIQVLDAIKDAYTAERDAVARRDFGAPYDDLSDAERDHVWKVVPIRITLAEPTVSG